MQSKTQSTSISKRRIETGPRDFIERGREPEKDSYPKSQNIRVEDPQSSRSNDPVLTSVRPYSNIGEPKWIFKGDTNTEALQRNLHTEHG